MNLTIQQPFLVFYSRDGTPLESGYIYIGTAGQNPETAPISVYWDQALTIPATQPIRTIGMGAAEKTQPYQAGMGRPE